MKNNSLSIVLPVMFGFLARTVAAFAGGALLLKVSDKKFFAAGCWIALLGLVLLAVFGKVGLIGGAILPPVLGWLRDVSGSQIAAVITIAVVWLYMLWLNRRIGAHE